MCDDLTADPLARIALRRSVSGSRRLGDGLRVCPPSGLRWFRDRCLGLECRVRAGIGLFVALLPAAAEAVQYLEVQWPDDRDRFAVGAHRCEVGGAWQGGERGAGDLQCGAGERSNSDRARSGRGWRATSPRAKRVEPAFVERDRRRFVGMAGLGSGAAIIANRASISVTGPAIGLMRRRASVEIARHLGQGSGNRATIG